MRPSAPAGDDGDAIRGIVRLVPYWVFKDLMRAYRKRGQLERALAMVEARRRCGLDVDRFLHNDAIAVCTQAGYGVGTTCRCYTSIMGTRYADAPEHC